MSEGVQEIVVRTLTGESTVLSLTGDISVEQLKLILKHKFAPASNSPNFHLFFKGVKLKLQSKLRMLSIGSGDFLLLVPFTKKDPNQTDQKLGESKTLGNNIGNENPLSKFAESAWSDMMQDLSCMNDGVKTNDSNTMTTQFEPPNRGDEIEEIFCGTKRKKSLGCDDLVMDILRCYKSENTLDEENCERLIQVFGFSNCLSDPYSEECMLLRRARSSRGTARGNHGSRTNDGSSSCLCPTWLKITLKAFSFLNIVCAIFQLRRQRITLACLERALSQLADHVVEFDMKDLEHLSALSPKVVRFVDSFKDQRSTIDAIVIDCSTPHLVQVKETFKSGCRGMGVLEIFYVLKQRDDSFRTNLWEAVESFMFSRGIEKIAFSSLEEVLPFVNRRASAVSTSANGSVKSSRSPGSSSSHSGRCKATDGLSPILMVEHLRKIAGSRGQMVHVEDISSRDAVYEEIPDLLSQNMMSALKHIGVAKLYSHQAESVQASLAGKNVVVSTMTSSGKSLCYNLPVLEVLSLNMLSCALYLFPTKALAQDQLRALSVMTKELNCGFNIGIYDGDTSQGERKWLRDNARLMITNPDMLHLSILPYHKQFSRLLSNLKFVIVDEAHAYKGAFGCHTAFILRRLRRLCTHVYGSDPSFVFSTATSANPREHCIELANLQNMELIQNDGSPASRKLFILWNPVLNQANVPNETQPSLATTRLADEKCSSPMEVALLFAEMVQHGLRCIAFCKTRKLCELVLCYTREILQETAPHLVPSVCSYRAGYMAEDRRAIEKDLFGGKLCGVAATNALELGIDVGHIDVTLHLGFPGSIASLWQQAGRAGRRERPSLAVYVAFESPLDQYFMRNPSKLFGRSIECCHVDAKNQQVLKQHLVCAALEHPLSFHYDEKYFGPGLSIAIESLKDKGYLSSVQPCELSTQMWNYIGHEKVPSREVSIRAMESERYQIIDENTKEILEEVEESKAFFQVYDGAVYMRQGKSYLVTSLNLSTKIALCKVADLKYYTKTRDYTDIDVLGANTAYPARVSKNPYVKTTARADPCTVTTTWFGFHRVDKRSKTVIDTIDLTLPNYSYNSQAVWVPVPQKTKVAVQKNNWDFRAGLHAASHALLNVVPLRIVCNLTDLAPECANPQETRYRPERILLYDKHPGGVGISVQIQPFFMELLSLALELISSCYCLGDTGCPHCVQSFACKEYNEVLHRKAAVMIIKGVLDAEESEL